MSKLLTALEGVRGLALRLRAEDRDRTLSKVLAYRKSLLRERGVSLIFELLCRKEEMEIAESCQGDEQRVALALSAPGPLRHQAHEELKDELFAGEELKRHAEIREKLRDEPSSLDLAFELAESKWRTEVVYPVARRYIKKMDTLFARFHRMAAKVVFVMAEDKICGTEDIRKAIQQAFSDTYIATELREVFQSQDEFHRLREGLAELRSVLGDEKSMAAESALHPYLDKRWRAPLDI